MVKVYKCRAGRPWQGDSLLFRCGVTAGLKIRSQLIVCLPVWWGSKNRICAENQTRQCMSMLFTLLRGRGCPHCNCTACFVSICQTNQHVSPEKTDWFLQLFLLSNPKDEQHYLCGILAPLENVLSPVSCQSAFLNVV